MKKILSVLLAVIMTMACSVTAFAADGDDDESSTVRRIPAGTKVVTSDTLDDGLIDRLKVKTIYVPSSVTTIRDGALSGYANVTNVYIDNSKDNITIEKGALADGANIVYTEKPAPPPEPTTTTTTKKSEESTTKKDDSDEKTTKKDDEDSKSTTKKTTKKTTTTKKGEKTTKKTVSSSATTSDPKNRTTVQQRPLTIPSTKSKKTTVKGPLIPEVEVDPDTIEEQPDPAVVEEDTTTVTFAGEAITDKDGTIIGFEDPQENRSDAERAAGRAKAVTLGAVGIVALSAAALVYVKLRRRP